MSHDVNQARAEAEAFKALLEQKIQKLVLEFSEGKISREQFQMLYKRYNGRLAIANQALVSNTPEAIRIAQSGPPTILVRDTYMGRAIGLVIYHNISGNLLETLGKFHAPPTRVALILKEFARLRGSNQYVERRIEKIAESQWLLFTPGQYTTVVTLFENEPSPAQIREIERLHHDFEQANGTHLQHKEIKSAEMADPFIIFVERWMQGADK